MDTVALILAILGGLAGVAGFFDNRATAAGVVLVAIAVIIQLT